MCTSLAKKLKYKISEEVEAEEIMVNNKSLEGNTNVLVLSDDLVLKDFDPKWAKYLTLKKYKTVQIVRMSFLE